jgi:hypothetical protein
MAKKWRAVSWSRDLPKPMRNGRFYRLGHHIAVLMAGHAHQDGGGITVGAETLAREAWCTPAEAAEAMRWLEEEKWFMRSSGPKGLEWSCNFELARGGVDEVAEKADYYRLRKAKNMRDLRARRNGEHDASAPEASVTVSGHSPVTYPGHADTTVTGVSDRRDRGELPVLPGTVTAAGHLSGHTCRSEPRKTHKTQEDKREDPLMRAEARESDPAEQADIFGAALPVAAPPTPLKPAGNYTPEMDLIWKTWREHNPKHPNGKPKREVNGKAPAARALTKALKKTTLDLILVKIAEYMASAKPQAGYCQDLSTWLNACGWEEDWIPHRAASETRSNPADFKTDTQNYGNRGRWARKAG